MNRFLDTQFALSRFKLKFYCGAIFLSVLMCSNFIGNYHAQFIHFSLSLSTLVFPLVYWLVVVYTEVFGRGTTLKYVALGFAVNFLTAILIFIGFKIPLPEFWTPDLNKHLGSYTWLGILILSLSFLGSGVSLVLCLSGLKHITQDGLFVLRAVISLAVALVVELIFLSGFLLLTQGDYMALWKFISLASVKIYAIIFIVPLAKLGVWVLNPIYSNCES